MAAQPHDLAVAEWMGLDTEIEGILLATSTWSEHQSASACTSDAGTFRPAPGPPS
jgi:hypothetical protein